MSHPTRFTHTDSMEELAAAQRIASAQLPPERLRTLLESVGGQPTQAFRQPSDALRKTPISLTEKQVERLNLAARQPLPKDFEKKVTALRVQVITWSDPAYPEILLPLADAPPLLFVRGTMPETAGIFLAIVGSRRATLYGQGQAQRFGRSFAESGATVVSGGAAGIDTIAHRSAVDAGGHTIAVLGCGVDHAYPAANRNLFARIAEGCGAVISEYPLETTPEPWRFPARNRIIAGLSRATVVIESPSHSGALITARCAAEYGRAVFAVPGDVESGRSRGCHELIRDGAFIADSPDDVLFSVGLSDLQKGGRERRKADEVPLATPGNRFSDKTGSAGGQRARRTASSTIPSPSPPIAVRPAVPLSSDEERTLERIGVTPGHLDDIAASAGLTAAQVTVAVTLLEMKGLIRRLPGNLFVRNTS